MISSSELSKLSRDVISALLYVTLRDYFCNSKKYSAEMMKCGAATRIRQCGKMHPPNLLLRRAEIKTRMQDDCRGVQTQFLKHKLCHNSQFTQYQVE